VYIADLITGSTQPRMQRKWTEEEKKCSRGDVVIYWTARQARGGVSHTLSHTTFSQPECNAIAEINMTGGGVRFQNQRLEC
jgi:hypothetical protein